MCHDVLALKCNDWKRNTWPESVDESAKLFYGCWYKQFQFRVVLRGQQAERIALHPFHEGDIKVMLQRTVAKGS